MYSFSISKKLILTAMMAASFSVLGNTKLNEATDTTLAMSNTPVTTAAAIQAPSVSTSQMKTETCPDNFYRIKIPSNGKLCQVFAADLPASMILHIPQSPEQVKEYYLQDSAIFSISRQIKDRFFLQSENKDATVIISADGQGTQVDILVKN